MKECKKRELEQKYNSLKKEQENADKQILDLKQQLQVLNLKKKQQEIENNVAVKKREKKNAMTMKQIIIGNIMLLILMVSVMAGMIGGFAVIYELLVGDSPWSKCFFLKPLYFYSFFASIICLSIFWILDKIEEKVEKKIEKKIKNYLNNN